MKKVFMSGLIAFFVFFITSNCSCMAKSIDVSIDGNGSGFVVVDEEKNEEEARQKAEEEARLKAEEEARLKAEEEAKVAKQKAYSSIWFDR